jgi:hypothetical protein
MVCCNVLFTATTVTTYDPATSPVQCISELPIVGGLVMFLGLKKHEIPVAGTDVVLSFISPVNPFSDCAVIPTVLSWPTIAVTDDWSALSKKSCTMNVTVAV